MGYEPEHAAAKTHRHSVRNLPPAQDICFPVSFAVVSAEARSGSFPVPTADKAQQTMAARNASFVR
jgi:hypothetical protein